MTHLTVQVLPLTTREHGLIGATVNIYTFDGTISPVASVDTTIGEYFFTHDEWHAHTQGQKLGVFDVPGETTAR